MSRRTGGRSAGKPPAARRFIYKTGLCEGTHVMTLQGSLPVEYLVGGDRVVTRNGAPAPCATWPAAPCAMWPAAR